MDRNHHNNQYKNMAHTTNFYKVILKCYDKSNHYKLQKIYGTFEFSTSNPPAILLTNNWEGNNSNQIEWILPTGLFSEISVLEVKCALYGFQLNLHYQDKTFPATIFSNYISSLKQTSSEKINIHSIFNIIEYISGGKTPNIIKDIIRANYNKVTEVLLSKNKQAHSTYLSQNPFTTAYKHNLQSVSKQT